MGDALKCIRNELGHIPRNKREWAWLLLMPVVSVAVRLGAIVLYVNQHPDATKFLKVLRLYCPV